jgi:hypothetical protein
MSKRVPDYCDYECLQGLCPIFFRVLLSYKGKKSKVRYAVFQVYPHSVHNHWVRSLAGKITEEGYPPGVQNPHSSHASLPIRLNKPTLYTVLAILETAKGFSIASSVEPQLPPY